MATATYLLVSIHFRIHIFQLNITIQFCDEKFLMTDINSKGGGQDHFIIHKIPSKTFLYCPIKLHRLKITPNKSLNSYIFHDKISSGNMLGAVFTSVFWGVVQRKYILIRSTRVIFVQIWNHMIKKNKNNFCTLKTQTRN